MIRVHYSVIEHMTEWFKVEHLSCFIPYSGITSSNLVMFEIYIYKIKSLYYINKNKENKNCNKYI